jgi:hypothetical protein
MPFNANKTDDGSDLTNGQRAQNAADCLKHVFDFDENDKDTAVSDLLANLMHLCDRENVDFADCLRRADNNYQAEK